LARFILKIKRAQINERKKKYFLQCSIKKKYEEQNETKLKYFPIVKGKTFAVFPIANIRTRTTMWPTLD